jgi:hypothetical protein
MYTTYNLNIDVMLYLQFNIYAITQKIALWLPNGINNYYCLRWKNICWYYLF